MKHFFKIFLTIFTIYLNAQNTNYEFLGTLQLSDKNFISYKLKFELNEKGNFTGETITDFSGEHRTVSKVTGILNKKKKTISFSESKNISTKSNYDNANFCFVNVNNALLKLKNNKSIIQGTFTGKYPNGKKCADGSIFLIGSEQLYKKLEEVSKKISIVKPNDEKIKEGLDAKILANEANNNILKSDDKLKINWSSDTVVFDVWDTQKEDGDKISIFINDVPFKKNVIVKNNKQTFSFPFTEKDMTITIIAENEGGMPSNTAQILLKDTNENFPIMTGLRQGEKVSIILKKN